MTKLNLHEYFTDLSAEWDKDRKRKRAKWIDVFESKLKARVHDQKRTNFVAAVKDGKRLSLRSITALDNDYRKAYVHAFLETDNQIDYTLASILRVVSAQQSVNEQLMGKIKNIFAEVNQGW